MLSPIDAHEMRLERRSVLRVQLSATEPRSATGRVDRESVVSANDDDKPRTTTETYPFGVLKSTLSKRSYTRSAAMMGFKF